MRGSNKSLRADISGGEVDIFIAPSLPVAIGTTELHLKEVYVNESNELLKKTTKQEYRSDTVTSNGRGEI